ncbi:family 10 glycosylhydrolase [Fulvivirga sp. M361]|uniref:glycoside hydrolase family 10 protein n=1 Tax=Fulvivirga sp. M361 TaxID=2594266 RepID=UPI00117A738C|nr:family 10 glycosylhydrolase [Fulvivirga sp. M361]TRX52199.1 family 10 glycosylhydrolase [Fulvivirga sp. M361]
MGSSIKPLTFFHFLALILLFQCSGVSNEQAIPPAKEGVRGVWLTNVASDVLLSRKNIEEAVTLLDSLQFNTIFMVTWNRGYTMYRSDVMKALTGYAIDPVYRDRDPLKEVIEEAHKRDIKVFAWFEFGFASSYDQTDGGLLLQTKPFWKALDSKGDITEKNKFQWMNGFHPEVQDFMVSLVSEVVENYEVDGIQGDDRLPAMPVNSGYDEYTVGLYQNEHNGDRPPENENDAEWIEWRAQKLNGFMGVLYKKVKELDPHCIVSMAPSIYPWSKENYLQDWPTWVNNGYVDLLCPQLYRYDIDAYSKLLDEILMQQLDKEDHRKFYPGVLLQVDDYNPSSELLMAKIDSNRLHGINGEVFFFYEGVKKFKSQFQEKYSEKVNFPKLR